MESVLNWFGQSSSNNNKIHKSKTNYSSGIITDDDDDLFLKALRERTGYYNPEREECYSDDVIYAIQGIYILSVVLWIIFIWWSELYLLGDWLIWFFIIIPPIMYLIGYSNACNLTFESEDDVLGANYLSFGFLITIILINWNTPLQLEDKNSFLKLLIVAFVLIMLSMIDIWVTRRQLSIVRHIRTSLQTAALVILSMSLYVYYRHLKV